MIPSPRLHLCALLGTLLLLGACGDQAAEAPPADAGLGRSLAVRYGERLEPVALDGLSPVDLDGAPWVRLSDVVAAAVPEVPLDRLAATTFLAADGFDPRSKSNCDALLPVAGPTLAQGYVSPATGNLKWDLALGFPGCLHVGDTSEILLADR